MGFWMSNEEYIEAKKGGPVCPCCGEHDIVPPHRGSAYKYACKHCKEHWSDCEEGYYKFETMLGGAMIEQISVYPQEATIKTCCPLYKEVIYIGVGKIFGAEEEHACGPIVETQQFKCPECGKPIVVMRTIDPTYKVVPTDDPCLYVKTKSEEEK